MGTGFAPDGWVAKVSAAPVVPLSYFDLKKWALFLSQELVGSQLQNVFYENQRLLFEFYKQQTLWLVAGVVGNKPYVLLLPKSHQWKVQKRSTPIQLFLSAHAKNQRVESIALPLAGERKLTLRLHSGQIDFDLVPGYFNVTAYFAGKVLHLFKPKELPSRNQVENISTDPDQDFILDMEWSLAQWSQLELNTPKQGSLNTRPQGQVKIEQALQKVKKTWGQIQKDRTSKQSDLEVLRQRAQRLQVQARSKLDFEELALIYEKIKAIQAKLQRSELRQQEIDAQIKDLVTRMEEGESWLPAPKAKASERLYKAKVQARLFEVDGFAYAIGKSGADNLKLLRSASAWDYWLHQKQGPGAHLILYRQKNQVIPPETLRKVAYQLIEHELRGKSSSHGDFEVVCTEARFVRPIKGASPGLVRYSQEISFVVRYP